MGSLFAHREPFDDETLEGFMIRLCEANAIPTMGWLLEEIADQHYRTVDRGVIDVLTSGQAVAALEALANLEPGSLRRFAYDYDYWGAADAFCRGLFRWPASALAIEHHQVCPSCLREANYHRSAWSYYHAPVCTVHRRTLIDQCPKCHKPIRCSRPQVSHCKACGADLSKAEGDPVPDHVAEFAKRIQQPHMLAMGSAEYTEPVTPDELFRLWCLAHIPRPGEALDVTHAFKAAKLPLERRLESLAGLAGAWADHRLDSVRLREHFVRRWAHLRALPCDTLVEAQIRSVCQTLLLNRELTHVLLHDAAPSRLRDSLVAFGTQPPQLLSQKEVAGFLEAPVAALKPLFGWSGILSAPEDGEGFDADELLEAKRFLRRMLTAKEVDRAVGVDGAAAELEHLRLLAPWPGLTDQAARYPASTLVQLFDKIFESIASPETETGVTRLQDGLRENTDPRALVNAVALVLNGGLRVYGWAPPFRWVDLAVNADELRRALVEAKVEPGAL